MELIWQQEAVKAHSVILADSYRRWTGRELLARVVDREEWGKRLFEAPFVVVSHGTEADPVLNYGNAAALALWELSWDELIRTPSRLTAEAPERAERAKLLAAVAARGFIDNYEGIRISRRGRRFRITRATVWNLVTPEGASLGQAAIFSDWAYLRDN
ncbi:MAG: MEKHLA domain-containing protein [Verrucomicrobiales bacterium]